MSVAATMIPTPTQLELTTAETLARIVASRIQESGIIDFKEALYEKHEKGIAEWCKDISAFANADGGVIALGISESGGAADALVGIDGDPDACVRRLRELADAHLDPRIDIKHKVVSLSDGKFVLLVGTTRLSNGPCMTRFQNACRHYKRAGSQIHIMDTDQLREAFMESRSAEAAASARFTEDTSPLQVNNITPAIRFCLGSYASPKNGRAFDPTDDHARARVAEVLTGVNPTYTRNARIDFDGLVSQMTGHEPTAGKVRRNGDIFLDWFYREPGDLKIVSIPETTGQIKAAVEHVCRLQEILQDRRSRHLLLLVKGTLGLQSKNGLPPGIEHVPVKYPELRFDALYFDPTHPPSIDATIRPWLDRWWNAFGLSRCLAYDSAGHFSDERLQRVATMWR